MFADGGNALRFGYGGGMVRLSKLSAATVRSIAMAVGILAFVLLPVAEIGGSFLLGNLHPSLENFFVFSGRWAFEISCVITVGLAAGSWWMANRRLGLSLLLLIGAVALPIAGRAWLMHVDSIVSYPPGYFS